MIVRDNKHQSILAEKAAEYWCQYLISEVKDGKITQSQVDLFKKDLVKYIESTIEGQKIGQRDSYVMNYTDVHFLFYYYRKQENYHHYAELSRYYFDHFFPLDPSITIHINSNRIIKHRNENNIVIYSPSDTVFINNFSDLDIDYKTKFSIQSVGISRVLTITKDDWTKKTFYDICDGKILSHDIKQYHIYNADLQCYYITIDSNDVRGGKEALLQISNDKLKSILQSPEQIGKFFLSKAFIHYTYNPLEEKTYDRGDVGNVTRIRSSNNHGIDYYTEVISDVYLAKPKEGKNVCNHTILSLSDEMMHIIEPGDQLFVRSDGDKSVYFLDAKNRSFEVHHENNTFKNNLKPPEHYINFT